MNKSVKTFKRTLRNRTTYGDAYNIPPIYMKGSLGAAMTSIKILKQQMD